MSQDKELTYLAQVRVEVQDLQEARITAYKEFMTDYIVPQLADSEEPHTAVVLADIVINAEINLDGFSSWLKGEGFTYSSSGVAGGKSIVISYCDEEELANG